MLLAAEFPQCYFTADRWRPFSNFQATVLAHQPLPLFTIDREFFYTSVSNVDLLLSAIHCKMAPLMGLPLAFPVKNDMIF